MNKKLSHTQRIVIAVETQETLDDVHVFKVTAWQHTIAYFYY